jgi:hypothetical protein
MIKSFWHVKFAALIFSLIGIGFLMSGESGSESRVREILLGQGPLERPRFSRFFSEAKRIQLVVAEKDDQLLSISSVMVNRKNQYMIADGSRNRVLRFDSLGNFIGYIIRDTRKRSAGHVGAMAMGRDDDLYVLDILDKRLDRFRFPDYAYLSSIQLSERPSSFLIDSENSIITYGLYKKELVTKYDSEGRFQTSRFAPQNDNIRKFLARFAVGNVASDGQGGFVIFYPGKFQFLYYSHDLHLKRVLKSPTSEELRPEIPEFPDDLSPYDVSPRHLEWWGRFLHADKIFTLRDGIIALLLHKSKGISEVNFYLSLFSPDGRVLTEGLEIPRNGIPVLARDDFIFIVVGPKLDENKEIQPPELYRYTFREGVPLKRTAPDPWISTADP